MLTPEAMLTLAGELTDAAAAGDAESLAAMAWRLYGEAGEDIAEIGRLRAALHAAWNQPQETASPAPASALAARWRRHRLRQQALIVQLACCGQWHTPAGLTQ